MSAPVVIVGGGITGLSAAWELERAGADYVLLEAGERWGGVLASERRQGFVLELGPDSFLSHKPQAAELCAELGIEARLQTGLPHSARTRILHRGRLCELPRGWMMLAPSALLPALTTPLLTPATKLRLAWRWLRAAPPARGEETVAEFLRRHFTPQLVAAIADPLLRGVYGGSVEQLSAAEVLPRFTALESRGNLLRGLRRASRKQADGGAGLFTTLDGGMATLPERLVALLPAARLRLNARAVSVRAGGAAPGSGYRVAIQTHAADAGVLDARAVILALPAGAAGALLAPLEPGARGLREVAYASAVTVNLAYRQAPPLPPGYGFLVPRREGLEMLACTFVHQKFAARAPAGSGLLRVFYGGEAWLRSSDDHLAAMAQSELHLALKLDALPDLVRVARWPRAMAQYTVGHRQRMEAVRAALACHPGVHLAGNACQGIGIPDCIASGRAAARALLAAGGAAA